MLEDDKNKKYVPMVSYWLDRNGIPPSVEEEIEDRLDKLDYKNKEKLVAIMDEMIQEQMLKRIKNVK